MSASPARVEDEHDKTIWDGQQPIHTASQPAPRNIRFILKGNKLLPGKKVPEDTSVKDKLTTASHHPACPGIKDFKTCICSLSNKFSQNKTSSTDASHAYHMDSKKFRGKSTAMDFIKSNYSNADSEFVNKSDFSKVMNKGMFTDFQNWYQAKHTSRNTVHSRRDSKTYDNRTNGSDIPSGRSRSRRRRSHSRRHNSRSRRYDSLARGYNSHSWNRSHRSRSRSRGTRSPSHHRQSRYARTHRVNYRSRYSSSRSSSRSSSSSYSSDTHSSRSRSSKKHHHKNNNNESNDNRYDRSRSRSSRRYSRREISRRHESRSSSRSYSSDDGLKKKTNHHTKIRSPSSNKNRKSRSRSSSKKHRSRSKEGSGENPLEVARYEDIVKSKWDDEDNIDKNKSSIESPVDVAVTGAKSATQSCAVPKQNTEICNITKAIHSDHKTVVDLKQISDISPKQVKSLSAVEIPQKEKTIKTSEVVNSQPQHPMPEKSNQKKVLPKSLFMQSFTPLILVKKKIELNLFPKQQNIGNINIKEAEEIKTDTIVDSKQQTVQPDSSNLDIPQLDGQPNVCDIYNVPKLIENKVNNEIELSKTELYTVEEIKLEANTEVNIKQHDQYSHKVVRSSEYEYEEGEITDEESSVNSTAVKHSSSNSPQPIETHNDASFDINNADNVLYKKDSSVSIGDIEKKCDEIDSEAMELVTCDLKIPRANMVIENCITTESCLVGTDSSSQKEKSPSRTEECLETSSQHELAESDITELQTPLLDSSIQCYSASSESDVNDKVIERQRKKVCKKRRTKSKHCTQSVNQKIIISKKDNQFKILSSKKSKKKKVPTATLR